MSQRFSSTGTAQSPVPGQPRYQTPPPQTPTAMRPYATGGNFGVRV